MQEDTPSSALRHKPQEVEEVITNRSTTPIGIDIYSNKSTGLILYIDTDSRYKRRYEAGAIRTVDTDRIYSHTAISRYLQPALSFRTVDRLLHTTVYRIPAAVEPIEILIGDLSGAIGETLIARVCWKQIWSTSLVSVIHTGLIYPDWSIWIDLLIHPSYYIGFYYLDSAI